MIILDDFDNNNIERIESFNSSLIYNRLLLTAAESAGFYVFVCNFGSSSTITIDAHWGTTRVQSGSISANTRTIVNYINSNSSLLEKGISASIIKNYQIGTLIFAEAILILCDSYEDLLFSCSPHYLIRSDLDYVQNVSDNKVYFSPYMYDPSILYASILSDRASELSNGVQILVPDINFIGNNYASYKNLVNNYLNFYSNRKLIITLQADVQVHNALPLDQFQVRLSASNIYKYRFLEEWDSVDDYYKLDTFLIGSTKLDHGIYKLKLKEL